MFGLSILACLFGRVIGSFALDPLVRSTSPQVVFSVVPGIFLQSESATNASTFNFTAQNFGLINRTYPSDKRNLYGTSFTQWQRLTHYINTLNSEAPDDVQYKLLYLARHGEGYHNAAESYYGTPGWNCYWSLRDGNGSVTWSDARITEKGKSQALVVRAFWEKLVKEQRIKLPTTFYSSPLMRCLQTARLTWDGDREGPERLKERTGWLRFSPTVKEGFREGISAHTCDRRSNRSSIRAEFPHYRFERGFPEKDELWRPLQSETREAEDARSKAALDDVFTSDESAVISVTSHSGEIASLLRGKSYFSSKVAALIRIQSWVIGLFLSALAPSYRFLSKQQRWKARARFPHLQHLPPSRRALLHLQRAKRAAMTAPAAADAIAMPGNRCRMPSTKGRQ
jgi:broad specificity phosphatase PhoE